MYIPLSEREREYLLNQISVYVEVKSEKIEQNKPSSFTVDLVKSSVLRTSILQGTFIKYDDFLVVQALRVIRYNPLSYRQGLYEVFCNETINKIKAFAKIYGYHHLRIYTNEDVLIEQLFEHKAELNKLAGSSEIMACMRL